MLDFSLSPEQIALQKKAREFALKEILPVAWYYDQIDDTPLPMLKKAYDAGLINGDIPADYGGSSYGLIESVVVTEEFAAACPGLATSIFDNSLGMEPLKLSKNKDLKKKYSPEILNHFIPPKSRWKLPMKPYKYSAVMGIRHFFRWKNCCEMRACSGYMREPAKYSAILSPVTR